MQNDREKIIQYGIDHNAKASKIDEVLKKYGYGPYNPLTSTSAWKSSAKRILPSLKEIGRDAITFGGEVIKPISDLTSGKKTIKEIVSDPTINKVLSGAGIGAGVGSAIPALGTVGGAVVGGAIGGLGAENFINAQLSPYNINVKDVLKGRVDWRDVVQGAQHNPAYATLDFLTLGGAKALGKTGRGIGDILPKDSPQFLRQIFPDKDLRSFNRKLTTSIGSAKSRTGKNYNAYGVLEAEPNINREELVKQIRTGTSNLRGDELNLANALIDSLRKNEDLASELKLLDDGPYNAKGTLARDNVTSQYIMQKIDPNLNITFDDVFDFVNKGDVRGDTRLGQLIYGQDGRLNQFGKDLVKLRDEGDALWKNRKIAFLTEKFAGQQDPLNKKIARDFNKGINNYWKTGRVIGRATAKDLAPVLDESIKFQLDQVSHAKEFYDIMDDVLLNSKLGDNIPREKLPELRAKAMASIAKDIGKGELPDLNKALRAAGLDDMVDPVYLKTLNNVFRKPLNSGLRRVLNAFKKNVLATPHWFMLNRVGNTINNLIEGVTLKDIFYDTRKYKDYIPDQLKNQTSFFSYLNEGLENLSDPSSLQYKKFNSAITIPWNKLKRAKGKFDKSPKSLEDILDYTSTLYSSTNDLLANPIFRAESVAELNDRYANYIRQAKRVAEQTNTPLTKVLEEAKGDDRLYNILNTEVNKSLGDYTGRLYNLPAGFYNTLSEAIPFYRFYAQTMRTTAHQLANHPIGFQSMIQTPNKIGRDKAEEIKRTYGFNDDWYKGGVPYGKAEDGNIRTVGYEAVPISNVLGMVGEMGQGDNAISIFNPLISSLAPAMMFQRFGKTATTPRLDEYKRTNSYEVSNFKPTIGEWARYFGNSALGATSAWYNLAQRWGREVGSYLAGKGLQTRYDTHPFTEIPSSYKKTLPIELLGNQLGIKTYSNYKQSPRSRSRIKRDRRSEMFFRKKEQQRNKPITLIE